ncbi:hypothetical protein T439DRAFT_140396 [Meredithblackwellia eburnea MCA 4105]
METSSENQPIRQSASREAQITTSGTPHAVVNRLPPEVLGHILQNVGHAKEKKSYENLKSASLVCRQWRGLSQRALGLHIQLNSKQAKFWLDLKAYERARPITLIIENVEEELFRKVLGHCTSISLLYLQGERTQAVRLPDNKLKLDWSFFRLPALSNLRKLFIVPEQCILVDPEDTSDLTLPLETFRTGFYTEEFGLIPQSSAFYRALFAGCASTLQSLDVRQPYGNMKENFSSHFHLISRSVTDLVLWTPINRRLNETFLQTLSTLTSLSSIQLLRYNYFGTYEKVLAVFPEGQFKQLRIRAAATSPPSAEAHHTALLRLIRDTPCLSKLEVLKVDIPSILDCPNLSHEVRSIYGFYKDDFEQLGKEKGFICEYFQRDEDESEHIL